MPSHVCQKHMSQNNALIILFSGGLWEEEERAILGWATNNKMNMKLLDIILWNIITLR
jgi:hypothetical protein